MATQHSIDTCFLPFHGQRNQATRVRSLEEDTPGYSDGGHDGSLERAYCLMAVTILIMRVVNMRNLTVQPGIFGC
ncbi:uncharacterized protein EAE97_003751 [Botrytis byssoidea]|uniref:Uncharacterized protein n=1 Tax=Botrytis byssoidea TaxID=139641 RepID=A0A9P5IRB2_9HELO|nr:uncharacterized protein EAE97_003751 [Botrytis byssoidea]KAF7948340.1 hypothetical protein EAE97_003751 [Botrytis byssoidea]